MRKLLGGNIRNHQQPGAMAGVQGDGPKKRRTNWKGDVNAAASDFLNKRGFHNHINGFEAAAYNYPKASR